MRVQERERERERKGLTKGDEESDTHEWGRDIGRVIERERGERGRCRER